MFFNYAKVAWRNLLVNKSYSYINIIGLSIGMTCCLIIFQYVAFESSFDRFHEKKDHLFRVLQAYAFNGEEMATGHSYTAQSLAPALKNIPEIVNIARIHSEEAIVTNPSEPGKIFEEEAMLYVDASFTDMFTFPLIDGSQPKPLAPGTMLISQSAARKYFGDENARGKTLEVVGSIEKSYSIAGILKDLPPNSHMRFDMLLPVEDLLRADEDYANEPEGGWSWNNFSTYIEIHPDADIRTVESKMTDVYLEHRGEILKQQGAIGELQMQPLSDIHLNAEILGAGNIVAGSYRTIYFFLVVGLITLIIALVNYVNLATARAMNRSREVGVRKVVGARHGQLVLQFLLESAFTNLFAVIIALVLTTVLIPYVNDIAETKLSLGQWLDPRFLAALGLTLLAGTLLAGLYPAFVLSSFRPAAVLKGRTSHMATHLWLRRGLVIVQFTACIVLVAGTGVVYKQLNYMRAMDLGLDIEKVFAVSAPRVLHEGVDQATVMSTFVNEVRALPGVQNVALSSTLPGQGFNWNGANIRKATDDPASALRGVATYIDSAFASLYGLKLVAGQDFGEITTQDSEDAPWMVMVNETTSRNLGFPNPAEAVNQMLDIGGYEARVIGVYQDFKWSSAHQAQQNIVFGRTTSGRQISIRTANVQFSEIIRQISGVYEKLFPGNVFSYQFVDDAFDLQYRNDLRFATLFTIFAGMAIFIACLGLFGLVAFTSQQRTKEIGMRKVLGASVSNIVALLSKDLLKLVIIGFVLAIPLTLYVMDQWLQNFAYRIDMGVGIFILSGLIALAIALATVSWQSVKAAVADPVESLRSE